MNKNLINIAVLQIGWWSITLTYQTPLIYAAIVSLLLAIHFIFCVLDKKKELLFILTGSILGCLFDYLAIELKLFLPTHEYTLFPLWLICYWLIFTTSFSFSLSWLKNRWVLISILGFIMAPLTYYAGEKFGLLNFNEELNYIAYIYYGLFWAISYPLIFFTHNKITSRA